MASRSTPSQFQGMACPIKMDYGFVHGPQPAVGTVQVEGTTNVVLGSRQVLNLGASQFVGLVTNLNYDPINDVSTIRMVDWRDRLHDTSIRAAFNCQESDGRFYHILPADWEKMRKTFITKDLNQQDFQKFQDRPPAAAFQVGIAKGELISAWTLMRYFAETYDFSLTGEQWALQLLKQNYPLNLDWSAGSSTTAQAIDQVLQKCGMQFTCLGNRQLHVTLRGYTDNAFVASLVAGSTASFCRLQVSSGKIGKELNEKGRRVRIVGDRNKYEVVLPCQANWNPAWTFSLVHDSIELAALLTSLGLTEINKLKEMPAKYHDSETWSDNDNAGKGELPERKTRNEMLIRDYLNTFPFRAYVAEGRRAVTSAFPVVEDAIKGEYGTLDRETLEIAGFAGLGGGFNPLTGFPRTTSYNDPESNLLYPLSKHLVTDSNLQSIVYATSHNIERGVDPPVPVQHSLVPKSDGFSMEVEELVNPDNGREEYRIRILFNESQVWHKPGTDPMDALNYEPDLVLIRLCLEKEPFQYVQGEQGQSLRVRERAVTVRNLYRGFVNGNEKAVLIENFRRDLQKKGQALEALPVKANDIAKRIATQLLAHAAVTVSGDLSYVDMCGMLPDGMIDSVQVGFDAKEGVEESVNYTNLTYDDREITSPIPVKQSRVFKDEEEIIRDRLLALGRAAMATPRVAAHAMGRAGAGLPAPGTGLLRGIPLGAIAYGQQGVIKVDYSQTILEGIEEDAAWKAGTVLPLTYPAPAP